MTPNINLLTKIAKKSTHKSFLHSSLILRSGRLLSQGYNHRDIHAEVHALMKLPFNDAKGSTVINLMIRKNSGTFGNSKPCKKCMTVLRDKGIRKVIYFNSGLFIEERVNG